MFKLKIRTISLFVVIVMVLSMFNIEGTISAQAAENSNTVTITILGTSDVHGRFMPWDYSTDAPNKAGSLTQIYTIVKEIRANNPNTILVDAGDAIQDNSVELFNNAPKHPMIEAMNAMGYDVWEFGNHEFNFGLDILKHIADQFKGQILCGNVYKEDGSRYYPAYTIVERGGIKIGIIGMVTPLVPQFEEGTDHVKGLVFKSPIDETKKAIEELKGKVDAIVGVMHMGEENENNIPGTGVKDIAKACPELDVIIAGHMHVVVKHDVVNGVLITEPGKYGMGLSKVDLTFEKINGKYQLVNKESDVITVANYPSDGDLEKLLAPYHEVARADANTVIGELRGTNLVPPDEIKGIPQVQIQETPLTDLLNEVQLYYSKADVVAISIDNDKAKLDVGPIKKKDIAYNYQYAGGETTVYRVTGKDLKDYMEWSAAYFNMARPGDVTISFDLKRRSSKYSTNDIFGGVKYEIDLSKPVGSRIVNLKYMNGRPVKDDDIIKLGMNSYRMNALTAKGGPLEGRVFEKLWSSTDKTAFGENMGTIRNMTIRYIKEVLKGVVEPKPQNNWRIIGVDLTNPYRKYVVELVNEGIIDIPTTPDGKYTNIASINVNDKVTAEEIQKACERAHISSNQFVPGINKGEFYKALYIAIHENKNSSKVSNNNYGIVVASALNVRAGASTSSKIIGVLPAGKVVTLLEEVNGWYKIDYNGKTGYIYGKYVAATPNPSNVTVLKAVKVTVKSGLNVRARNSINAKKIGAVPYGTELKVVGEYNGWYQILYNNGFGYVYAKYAR
jgi:2',3'-cyclic-nucleotide 2'-phosphodiesterase / 3'-nucleotidase